MNRHRFLGGSSAPWIARLCAPPVACSGWGLDRDPTDKRDANRHAARGAIAIRRRVSSATTIGATPTYVKRMSPVISYEVNGVPASIFVGMRRRWPSLSAWHFAEGARSVRTSPWRAPPPDPSVDKPEMVPVLNVGVAG